MDYSQVLERLKELRLLGKKFLYEGATATIDDHERFAEIYGEIAEVAQRLLPNERIEVSGYGHDIAYYPNYIEAGFCSGFGSYQVQGMGQLNVLLGRVRQLAESPVTPRPEASITAVSECLRRFRECCQYIREPPAAENAVQEIIWIMLRAQFDRLEREATLPPFGVKSYRPDFGVPDLRLLIEAKFIGSKTDVPTIQESICADIPGYLATTERYDSVLAFVYDHAQKLRDPLKFIEALRSVEGIVDVIVVPGIGPAA